MNKERVIVKKSFGEAILIAYFIDRKIKIPEIVCVTVRFLDLTEPPFVSDVTTTPFGGFSSMHLASDKETQMVLDLLKEKHNIDATAQKRLTRNYVKKHIWEMT